MIYDLCIDNARIMDPATGADFPGALAVKDGKIAYIGREAQEARIRLDAGGLVLSPGFLDIHTHEDSYEDLERCMLPLQTAKSALLTGVTTIVTGNCGMSSPDAEEYEKGLREKNVPINCYMLAGNATLRRAAGLGSYDTASPAQIEQMCAHAEKLLGQGAVGISFGLQYDPGTSFEEEKALWQVAAKKGKIVTVHMRWDYPSRTEETLEEMLKLASATGARLEISHIAANLYGTMPGGENSIAWADRRIRESGCDISCDMYPYNAWGTVLQSAVFDHGFGNFNFNVEDVEILTGEYAGQYCTKELFDRLRAQKKEVKVTCHNAMPIEDVEAAYRLPYCMLGSDGQMRRTPDGHLNGHPRGAGSPARFLGHFVRERKLFSLMEGLRRLTALPAVRFGLAGKGRLAIGADADLTVFDPETIIDRSRFGVDVCGLPPAGIRFVVVGGKVHEL